MNKLLAVLVAVMFGLGSVSGFAADAATTGAEKTEAKSETAKPKAKAKAKAKAKSKKAKKSKAAADDTKK